MKVERMAKGKQKYEWKWILTVLVGIGIFLLCLFPLRALLNYHEESHLFRWTSYYFREQMTSWQGFQEFAVSFIVQFFYVAALGSFILALLVMAFQRLTWWILKKVGRWEWGLYLLSFIPALCLFFYFFIPKDYWNDEKFREVVTYDYLERTHQWQSILKLTKSAAPKTECGIWCTNYALGMTGQLDQMESYPQCGPEGLLNDALQKPSFALYSMSDIYFQLGSVNEAERIAFNAKQYLPNDHKSGRLYRRLAEANIVNGHYDIAAKYLHFLESTIFYRTFAKRWLSDLGDEAKVDAAYARVRQFRQKEGRWLTSNAKEVMLLQLVETNEDNKLAFNYLVAYRLLQLGYIQSDSE